MSRNLYFEENKPVYTVINEAFKSIKSKGFYNAIFTDKYEELDTGDQQMVVGVIMGDYGLDIKDLIDLCIDEKTINKVKSFSVVNGVIKNVKYQD